jgi:hypothetical protein
MTATMDRFWIAIGVNEQELLALKARPAIYAALHAMTGLSTCLATGIVSNVVGMVA